MFNMRIKHYQMQCLNFACHLPDFFRGSLLANDHLTVILESCLVKGGREERDEERKAKHLVLCWEAKNLERSFTAAMNLVKEFEKDTPSFCASVSSFIKQSNRKPDIPSRASNNSHSLNLSFKLPSILYSNSLTKTIKSLQ